MPQTKSLFRVVFMFLQIYFKGRTFALILGSDGSLCRRNSSILGFVA